MNSVINTNREELLAQLKTKKTQIMKDETDARHNIATYF